GVKRLGLEEKITEIISTDISLPAIGQGALGIETRQDDRVIEEQIQFLEDRDSWIVVSAERSFLKKLEGGCQVPIAAFARAAGATLQIEGLVGTIDGKRILRERVEGDLDEPESLGTKLADILLSKGAKAILDEVYQKSSPTVSIEEQNNG
ncbi:MAG: hydroxymethylbilane synthase, partial [Thermodesulfobacteriota bacterium]